MIDLVYIVKDAKINAELKYSLRSVCSNLDTDYRVVFIGGCPDEICPDLHLAFRQGENKHNNVRAMLKAVLRSDEISEDFYLMNDDFFIMKRMRDIGYYYDGRLEEKVEGLSKKYGKPTTYAKRLERTQHRLTGLGCDALNYELHIPMLINRTKGIEVINQFNDDLAFRSAYGNYWTVGGCEIQDCKILKNYQEPDREAAFLSTLDDTFTRGLVGEHIRAEFKEPCMYERAR